MAKLLICFTLLCVVVYVSSLTCNNCHNKENCEKPTSVDCKESEKYCVSIGVPDMNLYGKGCTQLEGACEKEGPDGKKLYPQCESCQEDNCNNLKFE